MQEQEVAIWVTRTACAKYQRSLEATILGSHDRFLGEALRLYLMLEPLDPVLHIVMRNEALGRQYRITFNSYGGYDFGAGPLGVSMVFRIGGAELCLAREWLKNDNQSSLDSLVRQAMDFYSHVVQQYAGEVPGWQLGIETHGRFLPISLPFLRT